MSFESLMAASQRLSVSVETMAAVGAQLRLQQEGLDADPRVGALLNEIARAVDPQLLENVDTHQQAVVLALIQTMFHQALDLLENPARAPRVELHRPGHPSIAEAGVAPNRPRN